jgi:hypothetical protein
MSGIQEPAFTSQVTEWLSDKDNVPVLDDLQKCKSRSPVSLPAPFLSS